MPCRKRLTFSLTWGGLIQIVLWIGAGVAASRGNGWLVFGLAALTSVRIKLSR